MTAVMACETKGFTVERAGDFAKAKPVQPVSDCLDCHGTGFLRTQVRDNGRIYDSVAPCPRARMERRVDLFNAACIPAVHAASTLDSFKGGFAEHDAVKQEVKRFLHSWPTPRGFIIAGPVGTGKTHLLAAALRYLTLERGVKCAYAEITFLYAQIRRGFNDGKSGGEIIQPLPEVDVLAIDEIGKGRGSQFELDTLDELISRRYNAGRVTLFATNYGLKVPEAPKDYLETKDLAAKEARELYGRIGDRMFSRICEMCDLITMPGHAPDKRRSHDSRRR